MQGRGTGHPVGEVHHPLCDRSSMLFVVDKRLVGLTFSQGRHQGMTQFDCILDAGVHALTTGRAVHMGGITCEQDTS